MPSDPQVAIRAVEAAVTRGRLSKRRIDESLGRLLEAKQRLGLFKRKLVDLEAIAEVINSPETQERAQRISDSAVTAVKNEGNFLPLQGSSTACFVILSENRHNTQGHLLLDELAKRVPAAPVELLDPLMSDLELDQKVQRVKACEQIVVAAFASVTDYRGSAALAGGYPAFLESVIASGRPVLLGALGNPYLLRDFPKVSAYLATYSPSPPSEIAFVKAVFGEIHIRGRLPVTIPGQASRGDGLQIAARAR
jgi:beta-N-acetylhexosaminidase